MRLDYILFSFFNSFVGRSAVIDAAVIFFGVFAIYLFVPFFLLHKGARCRNGIFSAAIALGGSYATNAVISIIFYRDRPFLSHNVNQIIDVLMPTKSFPSDHSALAFTAATVLFLFSKKKSLSFFVFAFAAFIALARVIGGVHYPLDVIVGACIGIGWGVGAYHLTKRYEKS